MKRVLVVEDEAIPALDLKMRLREWGYEVTASVSTADEAVAAAEKDPPDLVLMDVVLPGRRDGIAAANAIQARTDAPVIFITAVGLPDGTLTGGRRRAAISKPFDPERLRSTIRELLE